MARSHRSDEQSYGSLTVFEAAIVGSYVGWVLQQGGYSMPEIVAAGIVSVLGYLVLIRVTEGSILSQPLAILSIIVWGSLGWALGAMAFEALDGTQMKAAFLTEPTVWRWVCAVALVALALADKQKAFTPAIPRRTSFSA